MGISEVLTAPRAPWQNPFVERMIAQSAASAWIIITSLADRRRRGLGTADELTAGLIPLTLGHPTSARNRR